MDGPLPKIVHFSDYFTISLKKVDFTDKDSYLWAFILWSFPDVSGANFILMVLD